jgi:putative endonuclease
MPGSHSTPASRRSAVAHGRPLGARPESNVLSKRSASKDKSLSKVSAGFSPARVSSATIPVVPPPGPVPGGVFVYLIEGQDGALYAGSAKDVRHRLCQHESGRGSKFTRDHGVGSLVFVEGPLDPVAAIRRERQLKGWPPQGRRTTRQQATGVRFAGAPPGRRALRQTIPPWIRLLHRRKKHRWRAGREVWDSQPNRPG